jgi:hypothetical protein
LFRVKGTISVDVTNSLKGWLWIIQQIILKPSALVI